MGHEQRDIVTGVTTPVLPEGAVGRRSLLDVPVRWRLAALALVSVLAIGAVGGVGLTALNRAAASTATLEELNELMRLSLEADMAHDAVRGDVLRALLAADKEELSAAKADLADHERILAEGVARFARPDLPADVRAAASDALTVVGDYARAANEVMDRAVARRPVSDAQRERFNTAFTGVEEALPTVGDALARHQQIAGDGVRATRTAVTQQIVISVVVLGLLLTGMAWLLARSVLGPLRRVGEVAAALAAGDLTVQVGLTGRDEFAAMGRKLDQAVGSFRAAIGRLAGTATELAAAADQMESVSGALDVDAAQATVRADEASQAAEAVHHNLLEVRDGTDTVSRSAGQIAGDAQRAAGVASESVEAARGATREIDQLGVAGEEIGDVVALITSIAAQTNLLALNATIEAARAGAAGKGFAVVAGEVKELAQETARATADITARVSAIQDSATAAGASVRRIGEVIEEVHRINTEIATTAESQAGTARGIAGAVARTEEGSGQVGAAMETVTRVAGATSGGARDGLQVAHRLSRHAADLAALTGAFRC